MRISAVMTLAAVVAGSLIITTVGPASAKRPPCSRNEIAVADDRGGGKKLCLKKSELRKAKKICAKYGGKNPYECICQDGDSVGACGD